MDIATIGTTDVQVTRLGMGGAQLGALGARIAAEQARAIVEAAWDGGVRYFDTAPLYGHGLSERRVGSSLASRDRDAFALSTKAGRLLVPADDGERDANMLDDEPFSIRYDYTAEGARRSLRESLDRLKLDRVDILLCHDIDAWTHGDAQSAIFDTASRGILPALQALREEGVIRAFGLGVNEAAVCAKVLERFDPDCFLLAGRFTLLEQEPVASLLPACVARNVSLIIGAPFNSGLLTNRPRAKATYDYKPVDDARWEKTEALRRVCRSHGVDIRAAALQYPLRHPAVAAVIPGVRSVQEVEANLEFIATSIPEALWHELADQGLAVAW